MKGSDLLVAALENERAGATAVEVPGSHSVFVSNAKAVADLIEQAASG
jgi:hypothetical protein